MARATTATSRQQPSERARAQEGERGVFALKTPKRIAERLKDMAEHGHGHADPYRSAMGMLTGRMSRAGSNLPADEKARLERTKDELRQLFQRPSTGRTTSLGRKVEKPGPSRTSGPSGQSDNTQHEKKHANK